MVSCLSSVKVICVFVENNMCFNLNMWETVIIFRDFCKDIFVEEKYHFAILYKFKTYYYLSVYSYCQL